MASLLSNCRPTLTEFYYILKSAELCCSYLVWVHILLYSVQSNKYVLNLQELNCHNDVIV